MPTSDFTARLRYQQSFDCLLGRKVPKDLAKSFALNLEAADLGHRDATLAMGWYYFGGVGVDKDLEMARKWYRASARQGEPKAMFSLGQLECELGDFNAAFIWFERAIRHGHARSIYWLARLHWRGHGVPQDRKRAKELFHRAAGEKVTEAQRVLRYLNRRQREH